MSYPEGEYTTVSIEGALPVDGTHWSPDGTRVSAMHEGVAIYTDEGEPIADLTMDLLGLELPDEFGRSALRQRWSPDSALLMVGGLLSVVLDRDGQPRYNITTESLGLDIILPGAFLWLPDEARALTARVVTSGSDEMIGIKLSFGDTSVSVQTFDRDESTELIVKSFPSSGRLNRFSWSMRVSRRAATYLCRSVSAIWDGPSPMRPKMRRSTPGCGSSRCSRSEIVLLTSKVRSRLTATIKESRC